MHRSQIDELQNVIASEKRQHHQTLEELNRIKQEIEEIRQNLDFKTKSCEELISESNQLKVRVLHFFIG